ncbi:MAG: hypothetical protein WCS27_15880 [Victivallaceae bacterium]
MVRKDSFTQLTGEAKVGDTVLKVADCSQWDMKKLTRTAVAFNAEEDFSDLPNFNLSSPIAKLKKKAGVYEITLKNPLKKTYPAGTKISQHYNYNWGGGMYCAASRKLTPKEWTDYSAVVKGTAKCGAPGKQFWPGTKYVRVVFLLNFRDPKDSDCQTLVDDISFSLIEGR